MAGPLVLLSPFQWVQLMDLWAVLIVRLAILDCWLTARLAFLHLLLFTIIIIIVSSAVGAIAAIELELVLLYGLRVLIPAVMPYYGHWLLALPLWM